MTAIALCRARAPNGGILGCRDDGTLALMEPTGPGCDLVVARVGADGDCFFEAPGRLIRLDGTDSEHRVLALRAVPLGALAGWQDVVGRPLVLSATGGLCPRDAPLDEAAGFTFERLDHTQPGSVLDRLPEQAALDLDGLTAIIHSGDVAMLPVAEAVLAWLNAAQSRSAWTARARDAGQDAFHPLLRAHGHAGLYRFAGYTADHLRAEIEQHGWDIGAYTYGRPLLMETGRGKLTIGRFCSLADPTIILGNHGIDSATSYPFLDMWVEWPGTTIELSDHSARDVTVGNDVWIGVGAILLPGAVIGDGAIIGAGAVVRGVVPPYGICVGNPGRVTRYRHDEATIARLLRLRWWDWPDGMVDRYIPLLLSREIEEFLRTAEIELDLAPAAGR